MHVKHTEEMMSTEELRYYIALLLETWPKKLLARTLGAYSLASLKSKLDRSWIYPGEQKRFTLMIDRILSGELVAVRHPHPKPAEAVIASSPQPIHQSARLRYSLAEHRLGWVAPRVKRAPRLLSFELGVKQGLNHGR